MNRYTRAAPPAHADRRCQNRSAGPKKGEAALVCIHVFTDPTGATHWHVFDQGATAVSARGDRQRIDWIALCNLCQELPGCASDKADRLIFLGEDVDVHRVDAGGPPC